MSDRWFTVGALSFLLLYGWLCALLGAYAPWLPFFPFDW